MAGGPRKPRWAYIFLLASLLAGGSSCRSTLEPPTGDPRTDLNHRDPRIRALAAKQVVLERRLDLVDLLIDNLSHRDGGVRFYASIALKKLTGEDFGYLPHATPVEREEAVARWREWASANAPPANPGEARGEKQAVAQAERLPEPDAVDGAETRVPEVPETNGARRE